MVSQKKLHFIQVSFKLLKNVRSVRYRTKRELDADLQECRACSIYNISLEKLFRAGRSDGSTEILTWRSAMFDFPDDGRLYTFILHQQLGMAKNLLLSMQNSPLGQKVQITKYIYI
jgi:hypothetical protein